MVVSVFWTIFHLPQHLFRKAYLWDKVLPFRKEFQYQHPISYRSKDANTEKNKYCILMPCSFPQRHDYSCTSDHRTKNLPGPFRMENCCTQTCCIQILCSARERWILLLWVLCFDFKWVLVPFSQIHNERSSNTAHYHTYIPTFKQLTVIIFFIHNPARRA